MKKRIKEEEEVFEKQEGRKATKNEQSEGRIVIIPKKKNGKYFY